MRFMNVNISQLNILLIVLLPFCGAFSQSAAKDTAKIKETVPQKSVQDTSGVLILEDIQIHGEVQSPGVMIIPRRVEPELKERELSRSFQTELKQGGTIVKPEDELRSLERVKSIRKALEKERKKE